MDEMNMVKHKAVDWFDDKNPSHWSRAFFKEETKCDILLNNLCESFNFSILLVRDKLILAMLERIRMDMMVRNTNRRVACEKWKDVVGLRIKKMLDKVGERATQYRAHRCGEFVFQVTGFSENGKQHAVDLGLHTCTCKRWQLSGIPCVHVICCIGFKKQKGEGTSVGGASTKKRVRANVQRAPAPLKESRPIKDQVIKSKKGWKKMKLAMKGSSAGNGSGSASTRPPTQSRRNHVARGSTK
ncbi:hypothetical protein ACLB2K_025197 [Fragaria x ananassa]